MKISGEIVDLTKIVGKRYATFWNYKGRYRIVKGGRGSKKSYTTALWFISNMMKLKDSNLLVVRKVFDTHRGSTFAQLKTAMKRLKVSHLWKCTTSPMEMTYLPTGQKIIFRGLDDPLKITSVTVEIGYLCWAWFEEMYQVENEDDFNKVDMSIRGAIPKHLFKQITCTFNPWSETHWLNDRFFKGGAEDRNSLITKGLAIHKNTNDVLAMTTNFRANEFLDEADLNVFRTMELENPKRFEVEGNGNWGICEGTVFYRWEIREFDVNELIKSGRFETCLGLDFGYTNDPTAFVASLIDAENKEIYVFDEHYEKGMFNEDIVKVIEYKGFAKSKITADSAEEKSIKWMKRNGLPRIRSSVKGPDSIIYGIQYLQGYKVYILPKCKNFIVEIKNYIWDTDKKTGKALNKPIDDYNHLLDAWRYSVEELATKRKIKAGQYKMI
ncbi:PBSX family phage terminase large subunit [uncultured Fusobacterium sp.]|uniref:PBSX family phage terminase large subunit n=1 Tax=uncultured Fusobacterium sp. TaxID=159267 RepID=UPI0025D6E5DF|nr:PBSX family phage terminase large subunit [uncultured Fusobacterium sp.]